MYPLDVSKKMKPAVYTLAISCLLVVFAGCATVLKETTYEGTYLKVGDVFTVPTYSVLFANRGYIDSIKPSKKKLNRLRDGFDFDGYSQKPKAEIEEGTELIIHKIYEDKKNRLFVTALHEGEKVNITELIRPLEKTEITTR